jgi:hypothetical protein
VLLSAAPDLLRDGRLVRVNVGDHQLALGPHHLPHEAARVGRALLLLGLAQQLPVLEAVGELVVVQAVFSVLRLLLARCGVALSCLRLLRLLLLFRLLALLIVLHYFKFVTSN